MSVLLAGGAIAVLSVVIYPREGGLHYLDVADHFINQYGIAMAALVAVVVVAWLLRKLPELQAHADEISAVSLRKWWQITLVIVTPIVLGWMMVDSLRQELDENYAGYDTEFLVGAGWAVALVALVVGLVLSLIPWRGANANELT